MNTDIIFKTKYVLINQSFCRFESWHYQFLESQANKIEKNSYLFSKSSLTFEFCQSFTSDSNYRNEERKEFQTEINMIIHVFKVNELTINSFENST